jgi:hypothetical protein
MECPKCRDDLPDSLSDKFKYCPFCGTKLFEDGAEYMIEISCTGQRNLDSEMLLFVDESVLYEIKPGESIYFPAKAGFHTLKFRYKIRNKIIHILLSSSFSVKASFNSLSGLIETVVNAVDDKNVKAIFRNSTLAVPVMFSGEGQKGVEVMLGEDEPEYELRVSAGLKEGILRIYTDRLEFSPDKELKKEVTHYKDALSVSRKLGSIDIRCEGNVHKVYSIPKDIYNEVMAFLTNRIQ